MKTVIMKNINGQAFNVDILNIDNLLSKGWTLVIEEDNKKIQIKRLKKRRNKMAYLILAYIVGHILAFVIIGVSNHSENPFHIISVEEAFIWSLLSWILVILILFTIIARHLSRLQVYKTFKNYYEGKSK